MKGKSSKRACQEGSEKNAHEFQQANHLRDQQARQISYRQFGEERACIESMKTIREEDGYERTSEGSAPT